MDPQQPWLSDVGRNLALAVITSSAAPQLLLDGNLALVAASDSFCRAFGIDPGSLAGKTLSEMGAGEWNVPQLNSLLKVTAGSHADVENYEFDLHRPGQDDRRLVINARKLAYGNDQDIRLLVAVSDVTGARLAEKQKGDLVQEKAMLMQELQHRVANSLQIIASVLMQSARKVQSEEARSHLHDAHQRVMSVASLQRQLATSQIGEVELRPYLTSLCESISASMIHDHDKLSLTLNVDDSITGADISVSLGLIVTELVINALKHAFPGDRGGKISVNYHSKGKDWVLSVRDDGIGMPVGGIQIKPGLGTSIVQALSAQLHAVITVSDGMPGTSVSVKHAQAAAAVNAPVATGGAV